MKRLAALLLALCLLLSACGGSSGSNAESSSAAAAPAETEQASAASDETQAADPSSDEAAAEPEAAAEESAAESVPVSNSVSAAEDSKAADAPHYEAPDFAGDVFDDSAAEGPDNARLDFSHSSEGYVAAKATSGSGLKIQVITGDITYNYDVPNDGTPAFYPFQSGDGTYTVRILENVGGTKYSILYSADTEVTLDDEFQAFLRPSYFVNYTEDSSCVKKAAELAKSSEDELDFIAQVYDYVISNVTYDYGLAETVTSGYVPDLEQVYADNTGICFDYASLTAAMLRSQGIPTRVIFGYVGDIYHAWNMCYTEESGWITVSFEVKADDWTRMDTTFAANGTDDKFIGDGSNYAQTYVY